MSIVAEKKEKQYLSDNAQLMAEWDWEKNNGIGFSPYKMLLGSNKKAWWICSKGHSWDAVIANRAKGSGCPYCAGQRVIRGENDLLTLFPSIAQEWHPTKNAGMSPTEIMPKSAKKAWWLCTICGNEWEDTLNHRTSGRGCPACARRAKAKNYTAAVINDKNRLSTNFPMLLASWNYEKNGEVKPEATTAGSSKKVWWICPTCGGEWQDSPAHRTRRGHGCPYCSHHRATVGLTDLETLYPDIAKEWDYSRNKQMKPSDFLAKSNQKIWWVCSICKNSWKAPIADRTSGTGCPECARISKGKKISETRLNNENRLSLIYPDVAIQWNHARNNGLTPENISCGSSKVVWWICEKGHEWQASVSNRIKGRGCPYCGNKKVLVGFNDLQTTHPHIAREWNYEKNNSLDATTVTYGSNKKVWWKCEKGHEWQAVISTRTINGAECPECTKYTRSSFPEQAIFFYIKQCYPDAINSYKDIFEHGMELDIYIPSLQLGIEYDGVLHTYKQDLRKYKICRENGIRLIRIKEISKRYPAHNSDKNVCDDLIYVNESTTLLDISVFQKLSSIVALPDDIDVVRDRNTIFESYINTKKGDSLSVSFPDISKEWHPTKNANILPEMVYKGSTRKFWWRCKLGHEWEERVNVRTQRNAGCPYCSSHRLLVGFNDLETAHPNLALEWHPSKNGDLTPKMFMKGASAKVWWKCKEGHEWEASISSRSRGSGCPQCARNKRKKKI